MYSVKTSILFIFALLGLSFTAGAVDVVCTAGNLRGNIDNAASVSTLKVLGSINADDIFFIDSEMPALRTLDLSDVSISSYDGTMLRGSRTYPAATIPAKAFAGSVIEYLTLPGEGPLTLADGAFAGSSLKGVNIPASVTAMGMGVFADCRSLVSVTLGTQAVGSHTFENCPALADVTLDGVRGIGDYDFAGCTSLASARIGNDLETIGAGAFKGCGALEAFNFKEPLKSIGESAFAASGLVTVALGAVGTLTDIGDWAFAHCTALTAASLPDGVALIGEGLFFDCPAMEWIHHSARNLDDYAFSNSGISRDDLLPEGVETVGAYAMKGLDRLSSVTLPSTLQYLGDNAMEGMTGLENIQAGTLKSVPDLGENVWQGVEQYSVELIVSQSVAPDFMAAEQWKEFHISGLSTLTHESVVDAALLQGRFEGYALHVRSQGLDLAAVELYDVSGVLLARVATDSNEVVIGTEDFSGNFFIVRCILADGRTSALKLAR